MAAAARKVLLIGWDSADWRMLDPLLEAGLMPNLQSLLAGGIRGNLASIEPVLSPLIWTSIATGRFPHKHGVLGFIEPDPLGTGARPVGSGTRRCPALWNVLSAAGRRVQVTGWFAGHPAEAVNGSCVSERYPLVTGPPEAWPPADGAVYPPELADVLTDLRVHPREITGADLLPFIPGAAALDQSDPATAARLTALAVILAETASLQAAATWQMEEQPWDFAAVYFRALDECGHHFMPWHPPLLPGVDPDEARLYGGVMNSACIFHDMMLGRLLELAGPDATIILCSDHGFHSGQQRPGTSAHDPATMAGWHRPQGILVMHGPGIVPGDHVYGATVLDIAPTILHLCGLPVDSDMDGKVLLAALTHPGNVQRTASVPDPAAPREPPRDAAAEQAVLEQLIALGYLEPSQDRDALARTAAHEIEANRISSLLCAGESAEAESVARALVAAAPDERRYHISLVQTLLAGHRLPEARAALEALEADAGPCPVTNRVFANLLLLEDRLDEAAARLARVPEGQPDTGRLHEQFGSVHLRARRWTDAEGRYRRAIAWDEDSPVAWQGLAAALVRQHRDNEALTAALTSVGLQHYQPAGHFQLGAILSKMNRPEEAIRAFETGLLLQPGNLMAHRYLHRLWMRLGHPHRAAAHQDALRQLRAAP